MKPSAMLLAACTGSMWSLARAAEDPDEDCAPGRCPGDSGGGIDYNPPGWPPAVPGDQYAWYATNWQTGLSHGNPTAPVSGWYSKFCERMNLNRLVRRRFDDAGPLI
jgi:hypothetical protein